MRHTLVNRRLLIVATLLGCGGDPAGGGGAGGTFSLQIDGRAWSAQGQIAASLNPQTNTLVLLGRRPTATGADPVEVSFHVTGYSGPRTYTIGTPGPFANVIYADARELQNLTGSLVIRVYDPVAQRIDASFTLNGTDPAGGQQVRITDGLIRQ